MLFLKADSSTGRFVMTFFFVLFFPFWEKIFLFPSLPLLLLHSCERSQIPLHRRHSRVSASLSVSTYITSKIFSPSLIRDRLFSAVTVTRFPRPVSPLQDVAIIIGSREQLAVLLQLYDYQLEHEGTTGWETLLWVVNQL